MEYENHGLTCLSLEVGIFKVRIARSELQFFKFRLKQYGGITHSSIFFFELFLIAF